MTTQQKRKRSSTEWTCVYCTLSNEQDTGQCEACQNPRKADKDVIDISAAYEASSSSSSSAPLPSYQPKEGDLVKLAIDGGYAVYLGQNTVHWFTRDFLTCFQVSVQEVRQSKTVVPRELRLPAIGCPALFRDFTSKSHESKQVMHGTIVFSDKSKDMLFQFKGKQDCLHKMGGHVLGNYGACAALKWLHDNDTIWRAVSVFNEVDNTTTDELLYKLQDTKKADRFVYAHALHVWPVERDWYAKQIQQTMFFIVRGKQEAETKLKLLEQKHQCLACKQKERTHVVLPCFHMCLCQACAEKTPAQTKCFQCKADIQGFKQALF